MIAEVLVSLGILAGGAGEVDEDVSAESYKVRGKTSTTVVNEVLFTESFNYSKERKDDDSQENSDKEGKDYEPEQDDPEEVGEVEPEPVEDVDKEVQEADDDIHSNTGGDGDDRPRTDLDDAPVHDSDLDVDGRDGQEREEVEPEEVVEEKPEPAETPIDEEESAEDEDKAEPEEIEEETAGTFEVTAYVAFCDTGCTGMTATGLDVSESIHHEGKRIVATDPDVIPTGSTVSISLDNGETIEAIAQDTGGDIQGNRIDLLVGSEGEASNFGRKAADVSVSE